MTQKSKTAARPLYMSFRSSQKLKSQIKKLAKADRRTASSWIFNVLWKAAFPNEDIMDES